jgi:spermidine synthase
MAPHGRFDPNHAIADRGAGDVILAQYGESPVHLFIAFMVSLLVSAAGLTIEIAGARLVAPILGSSIDTWTALITVVLAGFAVGHAIGGRVADMPAPRASAICSWSLGIAGLLTFSAPSFMSVFTHLSYGPIVDAMIVSTGLFLVPSILVSIPSAAVLKSVLTGTDRDGSRIGLIYTAGSIGAIGGSLLAGYILVPLVGVMKTMGLAAAACFLSALCIPWLLGRRPGRRVVLACLAGAATSLLLRGGFCEMETGYYCVRVVEVTEGSDPVPGRYLILDTTVHSAVGQGASDFPLPYMRAVRTILDENFPADAKVDAMFLGGGGFALPEWFSRTRPASTVGVVEIDPRLSAFVGKRLGLDLGRLRLQATDARVAVRRASDAQWDFMLLDVFSDRSIPAHMVTGEFFAEAATKMAPGGMLVANVIDMAERPRLVSSIAKTMSGSFSHVSMRRVSSSSAGSMANYIVVASDHVVQTGLGADVAEVEGGIDCAGCDPVLLTDDRAPISFLMGG